MYGKKTAAILLAFVMVFAAIGISPALADGITKVQLGSVLLDAENPECSDGASGKATLENGVLTLDGFNKLEDILSVPDGEQGDLTIVVKGDSSLGGINSTQTGVNIVIKGEIKTDADQTDVTKSKDETDDAKSTDETGDDKKLPVLTIITKSETTDKTEGDGTEDKTDKTDENGKTNEDDKTDTKSGTIGDDTKDANGDFDTTIEGIGGTIGDGTLISDGTTDGDETTDGNGTTNGDGNTNGDGATDGEDTTSGETDKDPQAAVYVNGSLSLEAVKVDMDEDDARSAGIIVEGDLLLKAGAALSATSGMVEEADGIRAKGDIKLEDEGSSITGISKNGGDGITCANITVNKGTSAEGRGNAGISTAQAASIFGSVTAIGVVTEADTEDKTAFAYGVYSGGKVNVNLGKGESFVAEGKVAAGEGDALSNGAAIIARELIAVDLKTTITLPDKAELLAADTEKDTPSTVVDKDGKIAEKVQMDCKRADKGLLIFAIQLADNTDRTKLTEEQLSRLDADAAAAKLVNDDETLTAHDQSLVDEAVGKLITTIKELEDAQAGASPTPEASPTATPTSTPLETATPTPVATATATPKEKPYYANVKQWVQASGKHRALDDDGDEIIQNWGWDSSRSTWYYFDENGNMVTDQWVRTRNVRGIMRWYHLSKSGAMSKGWQHLGDEWYYLHDVNGHALIGWQKIDDVWYYMDDRGIMQTGWIGYKDDWYFLGKNGAMYVGYWQATDTSTSKVSWQYFDKNGAWQGEVQGGWTYITDAKTWMFMDGDKIATDWKLINGVWYCFDINGVMQTGWVYTGKWYYMRSSGAMVTGWLQLGSDWYWLNSNGEMAAGTTINIGEQKHRFAANGLWMGREA